MGRQSITPPPIPPRPSSERTPASVAAAEPPHQQYHGLRPLLCSLSSSSVYRNNSILKSTPIHVFVSDTKDSIKRVVINQKATKNPKPQTYPENYAQHHLAPSLPSEARHGRLTGALPGRLVRNPRRNAAAYQGSLAALFSGLGKAVGLRFFEDLGLKYVLFIQHKPRC